MAAFLLRRLALTIPVVWLVVTLVFGLIHLVPGDPVAQMLEREGEIFITEQISDQTGGV